MDLQTLVFRALVSLSAAREPDEWQRLFEISGVIAEESEQSQAPLRAAALLITAGYHESRFSEAVGPGACDVSRLWPAACDRGRARSYYQLWRVACPSLWKQKSPRAELRTATRCARRLLDSGVRRCRGSVEGGLARYAVGHGCAWKGARARRQTYRQVRELLERGRSMNQREASRE